MWRLYTAGCDWWVVWFEDGETWVHAYGDTRQNWLPQEIKPYLASCLKNREVFSWEKL